MSSSSASVGKFLTLNTLAYPKDAYDRNITWKSSDTSIATVTGQITNNQQGKVYCKKSGTVTITASSGDKSKSVNISCKDTVSLTTYQFKLFVASGQNDSGYFDFETTGAAKDVTVTSTNTSVATVNVLGVSGTTGRIRVNPVNYGSTTIKFTPANGTSAYLDITVDKYELILTKNYATVVTTCKWTTTSFSLKHNGTTIDYDYILINGKKYGGKYVSMQLSSSSAIVSVGGVEYNAYITHAENNQC